MKKITIPWFDKSCSPNARVHWRKKAAEVKAQKLEAFYIAAKIKKVDHNKNIPVHITFKPKRMAHDLDNCLASIKAALDGIATQIGTDDKNFRPISIDFGERTKNGEIEIKLDY